MKLIRNKYVSPLSFINGKAPPYGIKGVLRYYHYIYDLKLGQQFVAARNFPCGFHTCKAKLYLPWDTKVKDTSNQTIYGKCFNSNYY